ncbi:MAG: hypothetical protein QOI88_1699 [Gammaproteobacteria bacterium]|nr:hypothetical protein [Gammaproteobacteria bacterium]
MTVHIHRLQPTIAADQSFALRSRALGPMGNCGSNWLAKPVVAIAHRLLDLLPQRYSKQSPAAFVGSVHFAEIHPVPHRYDRTMPNPPRRGLRKSSADARASAPKSGDEFFQDVELARATVNSIGDAIVSSDRNGKISYMNRAAEQLLGATERLWTGQDFETRFKIVDSVTRERIPNPLEEAILTQRTARNTSDRILIRSDGQQIPIASTAAPIHDQLGKTVGAVLVLHDVSESRAIADQLLHMAQHDSLTNLPNRLLFNDRLSQSITLAARHGRRLAVLFLDLDRFKHINDSLGHLVGDRLLKEVANRLLSCVRRSDTVSRQGGDEFIVLLSEVGHAEDAALAADKMRLAIMAPYFISDHQVHLSVSIGISVYPEDGHEAGALIGSADVAMYHAKDRGRNNSQFFKDEMNARNIHRQAMEEALGNALGQGQFVLHYQPIVDLKSGLIVGAESLIRWQHPQRGLMAPDTFITIAEEAGLIESIGNWVLRESCMQARAWIDAQLSFRKISVNVSAVEFNSRGFLDRVSTILDETGLEPHYLEIEITETAAMRDVAATSLVLEALRKRGVHFAMDDFGTGYSSLSNLMLFPIDTLKIDKSFVMDVKTNDDAATIVSAVISLGQSLRLRIVAEGIETVEQLSFLQSRACSEGQGYYFSKPIAAGEFRNLINSEPNKS